MLIVMSVLRFCQGSGLVSEVVRSLVVRSLSIHALSLFLSSGVVSELYMH